jgi:hypothetical protein
MATLPPKKSKEYAYEISSSLGDQAEHDEGTP